MDKILIQPIGFVRNNLSKRSYNSRARGHDTYKNIVRDGRVMVCLMEEGNIAVSIKGNAQVCKKKIECARALCNG